MGGELTTTIVNPMFNVTTFYIGELHQRSDSVGGSVDGEEIKIVHIKGVMLNSYYIVKI
jgi:hypothetical protein